MTLCCDRDGVYNNSLGLTEETCQRQKHTRLIDYPFELYVTRHNGLWCSEVRNANHNHDHSEDVSGLFSISLGTIFLYLSTKQKLK